MKLVKKAFKFVLGGGVVGSLLRGKKKKQITAQPLPEARRDDAAELAAREDELRRRKGSAADMILSGSAGAEAAIAPGKLVLGS